jgi:hypothetical protein
MPLENRLNQRDLHLKAALLEKPLIPPLKISVTQQFRCGNYYYILSKLKNYCIVRFSYIRFNKRYNIINN